MAGGSDGFASESRSDMRLATGGDNDGTLTLPPAASGSNAMHTKWRSILVVVVLGAAGLFLGYRCYVVLGPDSFDEQLAALAGSGATNLGNYSDASSELDMKMADAFRDGEPFWARSDREYWNVHDFSDQWRVSEGFVYTPDGRLYRIDRHPPTIVRNARLVWHQMNSPRILTNQDNTYHIGMYDQTRVNLQFPAVGAKMADWLWGLLGLSWFVAIFWMLMRMIGKAQVEP